MAILFRAAGTPPGFTPPVIAIRREDCGYGIRFGLSEAEDQVMHGPVFGTLPEALAWIDALDEARANGGAAQAQRSA